MRMEVLVRALPSSTRRLVLRCPCARSRRWPPFFLIVPKRLQRNGSRSRALSLSRRYDALMMRRARYLLATAPQ
jgi:hypothetical protein